MTALFVTATGTEIGKTFVACGLIRHLRAQGHIVDALKPVISGFDPQAAETSDSGLLLATLGRPISAAQIARISPFRFAAPLSPDMAARRENRAIDFAALVAFCRKAVAGSRGTLLIEGVGGVMAPLDDRHTMLDWIAATDVPVLLVAGSYLGTISHTLTALEALRNRGRTLAGLVISESVTSPVAADETARAIARFASDIEIVVVPRRTVPDGDHQVFARLAQSL